MSEMYQIFKKFFYESYHRPSAKLLHLVTLIKKTTYNKKTNIFSERILLLKPPPENLVYYNGFGRIIYLILNSFCALIFNKFFERGANIDFKEKSSKEKKSGNHLMPWPTQAIHEFDSYNEKIDIDFLNKIQKEYFESIDVLLKNEKFKDSEWWKKCRDEFNRLFFSDGNLDIKSLENFRNNISTSAEILNDQNFLNKKNNDRINKFKASLIINLYHKLSEKISLNILRIVSDSKVGENFCLNYRGQRLNQRILRYAYYSSQIKKKTDLKIHNKNLFLDIGGGYGGLTRLLKNIYNKSTFVIIELPELCMLSAYFLKKNFSDKKIGTFTDFKDKNTIVANDLNNYDFVILPQNFMEKFDDDLFDLIINTTSLGEMTDEMQDYYIKNIERCSKNFFYSVNRAEKRTEKYNSRGFYDFAFQKRWISLIYKFTHTYHIEFLGKKVNKN